MRVAFTTPEGTTISTLHELLPSAFALGPE
jgi:hypothetical protein